MQLGLDLLSGDGGTEGRPVVDMQIAGLGKCSGRGQYERRRKNKR